MGGSDACQYHPGWVASCLGWVGWGSPQPVSDHWVCFSQPIKDVVNITLRDINCQAEKNATHFMLRTPLSHCGTSLEDRGHANNEVNRGPAGALPPALLMPHGGFSDARWGFSTGTSLFFHVWKHPAAAHS